MIGRGWQRRRRRPVERPAAVPAGRRIYAIGDIHGRSDLLDSLEAAIAQDLDRSPPGQARIICLGDYVDRGPDSAGVIERLMRPQMAGVERTLLKGNHEEILERFLMAPEATAGWCRLGGIETMRSYGVAAELLIARHGIAAAASEFRAKLPAAHMALLGGLALSASEGDYFFCHAGVRPGIALERQSARDLLWIRDEFLSSADDFGKVVVHGHTPVVEPELAGNRINIDTGAFASNRLTCLVLEGSSVRLLATG